LTVFDEVRLHKGVKGSGGIAPLVLKPGAGWRNVVSIFYFVQYTNKRTIISQIITLLHVSTLLCLLQLIRR